MPKIERTADGLRPGDLVSADACARELIRVFAAALRALREDNAIPKAWADLLDRELKPRAKRGVKPNAAVAERDKQWAREMLANRLAIERGEPSKPITEFAIKLAERASTKGHTFTAEDIFRAESRWNIDAMSAEVWSESDLLADEGEVPTIPAIVLTQPIATSYDERVDAVMQWLQAGRSLRIGNDVADEPPSK